jgi:hypothetical protein
VQAVNMISASKPRIWEGSGGLFWAILCGMGFCKMAHLFN